MCFANAQGGTIVVGIQDGVGGPKAFVGSPLDPIRTVSRVYELTEPGLIVIVDALVVPGGATECHHGAHKPGRPSGSGQGNRASGHVVQTDERHQDHGSPVGSSRRRLVG